MAKFQANPIKCSGHVVSFGGKLNESYSLGSALNHRISRYVIDQEQE